MEKQRLFVDMDGTLATFTPVNRLETLYEKGYFLNLRPLDNVVLAIKDIIHNSLDIEVFILSSYLSDSSYALDEKNRWLDKHLPEFDAEHRIFPPCGTDKKEYIPGGIRQTDCLLDDYTHNLTLWQPPARGIKLLNGINHTKGTWKHDCIRFDQTPKELSAQIAGIMQGTERAPEQPKQAPSGEDVGRKTFIEDYINGKAKLSDLDRYVEYWHTHETRNTLQEFLGITDSEYELWAKSDDSIFNQFLNNRTKGQFNKHISVSAFRSLIEDYLTAADGGTGALVELLKAKLLMPSMKAEGIAAIKMQKPDARCVKTLQEWRKEGYHLKPGEYGKAIKVLTPYRQQFFQRDGVEVNVLDATQEEKQRILSGQFEVKDTVLNKMQLVFDITQTDCAPVDYNRVLLPVYQFIDPRSKYNVLKANIVEKGITVREATLPVLSQQGYYDQDKKEILINNSLKDYQQLAALCDTYGVCLIDETSKQPELVKAFEAAYFAMTLKSALGLPVDDEEVKQVAQKYDAIPNHNTDTLDSCMTRCQRANTKTMTEVDSRYQAIMAEKGQKMDMTRQDSVKQNFLQGLD